MNIVFKRIAAFMIDWITTVAAMIVSIIAFHLLSRIPGAVGDVFKLILILSIFGIFSVFLFRDAVFNGKSPGKKLLNLGVYDTDTLGDPNQKKLLVKSLFSIFFPIDGIVLLVAKKSIGEMVSRTVVMDKAYLPHVEGSAYEQQMFTAPLDAERFPQQPSKAQQRKTFVKIICVVVLVILAITILAQVILRSKRDLEECKLAYNYLVESETFEASGADESDVRMNRYSSSTYTATTGEQSQTVTIGFIVKFKNYEVILHNENDTWRVCDECTKFD